VSARVWVTGLGLITPLGADVETTWTRLVRGDRAIRDIKLFDAGSQRAHVAGEVDGFDAAPDSDAEGAGWSRSSAMAVAAAAEAMRAAAVPIRSTRVGLVVGGTTGGMFENEQALARLHAEPHCRVTLRRMLSHPLSALGDLLSHRLGPFARVRILSSACSSGANAIVVGASWLLARDVDIVVAGGADALCRLTLSGFNALGAIDPEPCRPFNRRRRGTSLGEGAGFLVLERAEEARKRATGVRPVAELAGWSLGAEAHHITNPAPDGLLVASLIERALSRAGLRPCDIDYVNAHGTGTPLNDAMEATAIARALGGEAARVPVSSSKGQIGHTLGGAGAIEAAITALVVSRRILVPTAGLDEPDPALPLVHVPHVGREVPSVRAALSNAFGFGGMDTVLAFTNPDRDSRPRTPTQPLRPVITGAAVFGVCGLLGWEPCALLPGQAFALDTDVDPDVHLDVARARRLDRAGRLAAVAVQHALTDRCHDNDLANGDARRETGVILGSAYGNVDDSAAFMHRIFERGARAATPAEFPNLVPSSPAGHVSIYLGLRGPTFTVADLATSGESAFVQATQLIVAGEAARIVAGAVEPKSPIVERVLASLFADAPSQANAVRSDLAAAIVVESEKEALAEGRRILCRVRQQVEWRRAEGAAPLAALQGPHQGRGLIVLPRASDEVEELLEPTLWRTCARVTCDSALGESDALGAVAIAVATGRVAMGLADEALVLGLSRGRGYAVVLAP
jgi:3-oxoacyl-[acyl-carrier-protein] synthase II